MIRRLSIERLASTVAMIPSTLEAKSGNHEAGRVYEYTYLAEANSACGNCSQNAIFQYSDKTFELTRAHFQLTEFVHLKKIQTKWSAS